MSNEEKVEKKVPLTQEEAQMRKSLLTKEDGTYNVKYDLVLKKYFTLHF